MTSEGFSLMADIRTELPCISPVLKTVLSIQQKVDWANFLRDELEALRERCIFFTACAIVHCKRNGSVDSSLIDVTPLVELLEKA